MWDSSIRPIGNHRAGLICDLSVGQSEPLEVTSQCSVRNRPFSAALAGGTASHRDLWQLLKTTTDASGQVTVFMA